MAGPIKLFCVLLFWVKSVETNTEHFVYHNGRRNYTNTHMLQVISSSSTPYSTRSSRTAATDGFSYFVYYTDRDKPTHVSWYTSTVLNASFSLIINKVRLNSHLPSTLRRPQQNFGTMNIRWIRGETSDEVKDPR